MYFYFLRKIGNNFGLQIPLCSSRLLRPEKLKLPLRFPRGTHEVRVGLSSCKKKAARKGFVGYAIVDEMERRSCQVRRGA